MRFLLPLLTFLSAALLFGQTLDNNLNNRHTLETNLELRVAKGDLGELIAVPQANNRRNLLVIQGGEELLSACLTNTNAWQVDTLISRLAHPAPRSTISCREKTKSSRDPVLHGLSIQLTNGSRKIYVHFDKHRHFFPHCWEVATNVLTRGNTSPYEIYRGLTIEQNPKSPAPPAEYNRRDHFRAYLFNRAALPVFDSLASVPVLQTLTMAGISTLIRPNPNKWGQGTESFGRRTEFGLYRRSVQQTSEFVMAEALGQPTEFLASDEQTFARRLRFAAAATLCRKDYEGHWTLVFPRVFSAFVTGFAVAHYSPGHTGHVSMWPRIGKSFAGYALTSFSTEWAPELKDAWRTGKQKIFHRH